MFWLIVVVLGTAALLVAFVRALWRVVAAWRGHRRAKANRCGREVPGLGVATFDGRGIWSFQIPFRDGTIWGYVNGTKSSPFEVELASLVFARAHLGSLAASALPLLQTEFQECGVQEAATSASLLGISAYPARPEPSFGLCFMSTADPDGTYEVMFNGLTPESVQHDD